MVAAIQESPKRNHEKGPRNEKGYAAFPLLLCFTILFVGGFGTFALIRNWRLKAELQLRLNQCVGESALAFRRTLNQVEASNAVIKKTRAALAVAIIEPPVEAALKATLEVTVFFQNGVLLRYDLGGLKRLARCGFGRGDSEQIPKLNYTRPPPDLLGEQALEWPNQPSSFEFFSRHAPRAARASVHKRGRTWQARWGGSSNEWE